MSLILKYLDDVFLIMLVEIYILDDMVNLWSNWVCVLNLLMLVCDFGGKVKLIEVY